MAKSQKRNTREPKKAKAEKAPGKKAGPKYLRDGEGLQAGQLGASRQGKKP